MFYTVLQSYYDILGLQTNAGPNEIKASFRRLAKLYHPDKNPHGKEHFEKILMAYEVLIDAQRRRQYDMKLHYGKESAHRSAQKTQKKKEWNFSDEELKRRQYYKENYRKEYQRAQQKSAPYAEKKIYNEFKYVLFAAPLAVALLMFIINGLGKGNEGRSVEKADMQPAPDAGLKMGDDPYSGYFKNPVYDPDANRSITLKNLSGNDGVVCVFGAKDRFLRCCFLKEGYQVELSQLPNENMTVKLAFGKTWNRLKEFEDTDAIGGFETSDGYYIMKNEAKDLAYPITLDKALLGNLTPSTEKEFFRRN